MKVHALFRAWTIRTYLCTWCLAVPQNRISSRMVPPFFLPMIHIGKLIEEELHRQERSVTWFANKLCCERTNVYSIFKRESIDTALLLRISCVLHRNFFAHYVNELNKCDFSSTEVWLLATGKTKDSKIEWTTFATSIIIIRCRVHPIAT